MKYVVKSPVQFDKKRRVEGEVVELNDELAKPLVTEGILEPAEQKPAQK